MPTISSLQYGGNLVLLWNPTSSRICHRVSQLCVVVAVVAVVVVVVVCACLLVNLLEGNKSMM